MLVFLQGTPADKAEIGDVFLLLSGVASPPFTAPAKLQGDRADVIGGKSTVSESVQTGAKNRAKYAITRDLSVFANHTDTDAVT